MNAQTTPGVLQGHHRNCNCVICNGTQRNQVINGLKSYQRSGHDIGFQGLSYINALERELESLGGTVPRMIRIEQL